MDGRLERRGNKLILLSYFFIFFFVISGVRVGDLGEEGEKEGMGGLCGFIETLKLCCY